MQSDIPLPHHRILFNLLRLRNHSIEPQGDKFACSNSHSRFSVAYPIFHDYLALDDGQVTRMWEFVLEDAGVDKLSGSRTDVGRSAENAVDGCFGERDVQECCSSDFAVDSVEGC